MKSAPAPRFFLFPTVLAVAALLGGGPAPRACAQAGALDPSYELGSVPMPTNLLPVVTTIAPQPDGKVVFGGINLKTINGSAVQPVVRTNADGTLDGAFNPPVIESYDTRTDKIITKTDPSYKPQVQAVVLQPDGKMLVGGSFYFVDGLSGFGGLVRLNADGTYDNTFIPPRFNGTVYALGLTADGKFLVGGDFSLSGATTRSGLVQLKSDGSLDTSFNPGAFTGTLITSVSGTNYPSVRSLAVQPDGKIVVGGLFSSINGSARRGVARIDADGTLDTSFKPSSGFNPPASGFANNQLQSLVLSVALQPDGKVLVGGFFSNVTSGGSTPINSLYRLNADGSQDAGFNVGAGTADASIAGDTSYVNAIALQGDGKILIGGGFLSYGGARLFALTRVNADGTLDAGFGGNDLGDTSKRYGPDQTVQALALESDGELLAGGFFANYVTPSGRYLDEVTTVGRDLVARVRTAAVVSVSLAVGQKKAVTGDGEDQKGVITLARTGDLTAPLTVYVSLNGSTGVEGTDFRVSNKKFVAASGGLYTVTFAAGRASVNLNITALAQNDLGSKTVALFTLVPTDAYFVTAETATAKVRVVVLPGAQSQD